jgi:hypothetical protein
VLLEALTQPGEIRGVLLGVAGGFHHDGGVSLSHHGDQHVGWDVAATELLVTIPAGAVVIPGVVGVDEVDVADDPAEVTHDLIEIEAGSVGVAGVEHHTGVVTG